MHPPHTLFRRRLLQGIAAAAATPGALAQTGKATRRVGVVFNTDPQAARPYLDALVGGIEQHGYRRGHDYVLEVRYAESRPERFPTLVRELLDARAAVLVMGANSSVLAAKAATSTVPIVMAGVQDPDTAQLVDSLARPGGNVTGVANMSASIVAKRLQQLHELLPGATRVAYLTDPSVPGWDRVAKLVEDAGVTMGLRVTAVEASTPEAIDQALAKIALQRPDALLVGSARLFWMHKGRIVEFCAQHRLPASYAYREIVSEGGLMSYGASLEDTFRMAGSFVGRILGGAKPADLPVEQPTRYEFLVNEKTANALGIPIPAAFRASAKFE
jgi:putative tryptophan/tyrosine transport system substrate-binding protein